MVYVVQRAASISFTGMILSAKKDYCVLVSKRTETKLGFHSL